MLKNRDAAGLLAHLAGAEADKSTTSEAGRGGSVEVRWPGEEAPEKQTRRAFVVCARTWDDFRMLDPSFAAFSPSRMQTLAAKLGSLLAPWSLTRTTAGAEHHIIIYNFFYLH